MGLQARRKVEKHFTWEVIARKTLGFYRELTEERIRRG